MATYEYKSSIINLDSRKTETPKNQYISLLQRTIDNQFYNSPNWWEVYEETSVGSFTFSKVDVRIDGVINAETGLKLGDDWKTLIFKDISKAPELGTYYKFDNNIWLTVNIEKYKNITSTCTVRRCNNTLRWIDEKTGALYIEPCAIEYLVKEPRNYLTQGSPFPTPGGFLHIETQFNTRTNLINENQRFLFGNPNHWMAYKIIGTGINDFRNTSTYNWQDARILTLDLIADFVNINQDDVVNGIADANTIRYEIDLNKAGLVGAIEAKEQLVASVKYNGNTVQRAIEWMTSNPSVATVDSGGVVSFVDVGECTIIAKIKDSTVKTECQVSVVEIAEDIYSILIDPNSNYVLEGDTKTYFIKLYKNGVEQPDAFSIECIPNNVPPSKFEFTVIDGNSFKIKNIEKDVSSNLTIRITTPNYPGVFLYDISLRGAWLYDVSN